MLLKYVYTAFIGLLMALFIGIGIAAFYPSPVSPSADISYTKPAPYEPMSASQAAQLREENIKQQSIWREHELRNQQYNKNVAIMTAALAVFILALSLFLAKSLLVIADGLLFGALLTLIYSLIRSFGTSDFKFMFVVVSLGLIIAITLGYLKLIKPSKGL